MKKTLATALIASSLALSIQSCKKPKKEDPLQNQETTVEQDKKKVTTIQDDIITGIVSMRNGQVTSSVKETAKLSEGDIDTEFLDSVFTNFERDVFEIEELENNNRLVLNKHKGVYSYIKSTNSWKKEEHNSSMIIKFPCSEDDQNNSLVFELSKYSDMLYTLDGDQIGIPSELNVSFKKNNVLLMSFIINSLIFKQDDNLIIPTTVKASLYINPLTTEVNLTSTNSGKEFNASIKLYDNNSFSSEISASVNLMHNNYSLIEDDDVESVSLGLKVNENKVQGTANVKTLLALDDPTDAQINSLINIDILSNNTKIADVYINTNTDNAELIYKDGSKEIIDEDYAQRFLDKIEVEVVNELGQLD